MIQELSFALERTGLLNQNQRLHWAPKSQRTKEIRKIVAAHARSRLKPVEGRQLITVTYQWPDKIHRDVENWSPTTKAAIDGLRDSGILHDDDGRYVAGVKNQQGPEWSDQRAKPMVRITIRLEPV